MNFRPQNYVVNHLVVMSVAKLTGISWYVLKTFYKACLCIKTVTYVSTSNPWHICVQCSAGKLTFHLKASCVLLFWELLVIPYLLLYI
jgi:hypothetical protein